MSDFSFDQQVAAFLAVCKTASLATVDAAGLPCAANVQYVSDDAWRLYWVSKPEAAHSVNVGAKPQAAITIYAHMDSPENIHGLQMRGNVDVVGEPNLIYARSIYEVKYPFTTQPPFREAIDKQTLYRFTPTWLRWIDNREHFGFKIEKDLT